MHPIIKRIVTHLTFYVLLAIVAGVLVGHFSPSLGMKAEPLGKWFIELIKLFIPPIIFLTITLGISSMGNLKKVGTIGIKSLVYFELVTTFALALGAGVALLVQPGHIDRTGLALQDSSTFIKRAEVPFSWLSSIPVGNFKLYV
jgi:aerobic C4-dicarboxylate transport protein